MKEKIDKHYPCKCGHPLTTHIGWYDGQEGEYPFGCYIKDGECNCEYYKQDNLRYLEIKYESTK